MLAYSKTYFLEHISENTPLPPPKKIQLTTRCSRKNLMKRLDGRSHVKIPITSK